MSSEQWVSFAAILPGVEGDAYLTMTISQAAAYYREMPPEISGDAWKMTDAEAFLAFQSMVRIRFVSAPDFIARVRIDNLVQQCAARHGGMEGLLKRINFSAADLEGMCAGTQKMPEYVARLLGVKAEVRFVERPA